MVTINASIVMKYVEFYTEGRQQIEKKDQNDWKKKKKKNLFKIKGFKHLYKTTLFVIVEKMRLTTGYILAPIKFPTFSDCLTPRSNIISSEPPGIA